MKRFTNFFLRSLLLTASTVEAQTQVSHIVPVNYPQSPLVVSSLNPEINKDLQSWALAFDPHVSRYFALLNGFSDHHQPKAKELIAVDTLSKDLQQDYLRLRALKMNLDKNNNHLRSVLTQEVRAAYQSAYFLSELMKGKKVKNSFREQNYVTTVAYREMREALLVARKPAAARPANERAELFYKDMILHAAEIHALTQAPSDGKLLLALFLDTYGLESTGKGLKKSNPINAGFMRALRLERDALGYLQAYQKTHDLRKYRAYQAKVKAATDAFYRAELPMLAANPLRLKHVKFT